jgi:hypothetical protein
MALTSRTYVYQKYKNFKQVKDNRSMDEICNTSQEGFRLQAQQLLLQNFVKTNPNWSRLVLYHGIGSGKTCTAITLAEQYLRMDPNNTKVHVVLPARLKTNFLDELISPCGMEAYISHEDFTMYNDPNVSATAKKTIKTEFTKKIDAHYNIMSFEKLKKQACDASDLKSWCHTFTKDRMIIIDEVHNLINTTYKSQVLQDVLRRHSVPSKSKGMNTLIFRYLSTYAHPSCKLVFMTATPIFDNISQLRELAMGVKPNAVLNEESSLKTIIDVLRGYVSYFPGTSANAYPSVSYTTHDIPVTPTQKEEIIRVRQEDDDDDQKEAYMSKQRQIAIACVPGNAPIKDNMATVTSDLKKWAPKVHMLSEIIKDGKGKHIVFSNFVQTGISVVQAALEKQGWVNYFEDPSKKRQPHKVFAVWDGSMKDNEKQIIKSIVNSKANIDGKTIKVILGSPSIKEGVSFKHIQHLHLLDPVWNQSAKTQVEGRAIRFCSHVDIVADDMDLRRHVEVHQYKSVWSPKSSEDKTCDQIIYDEIIPRKYKFVKIAEEALKKVAIDHYLFRNLYREDIKPSPTKAVNGALSAISIPDMEIRRKVVGDGVRQRNTCPKARRPDAMGACPEGKYKKQNKNGNVCCYVLPRQKLKKV